MSDELENEEKRERQIKSSDGRGEGEWRVEKCKVKFTGRQCLLIHQTNEKSSFNIYWLA